MVENAGVLFGSLAFLKAGEKKRCEWQEHKAIAAAQVEAHIPVEVTKWRNL